MFTVNCQGTYEGQEGCVLLMKCKLDLGELESTSGPLNPKVSGQNIEDVSKQYLQNVEVLP